MAEMLTQATHGKEDPERATLPFILANVAASADRQAVVLLTAEGVWLATRGYAKEVRKEGFEPLDELIDTFVAAGGEVWACGACTRPRGITEEHLIDGARIVSAANVVEVMLSGVPTLSF